MLLCSARPWVDAIACAGSGCVGGVCVRTASTEGGRRATPRGVSASRRRPGCRPRSQPHRCWCHRSTVHSSLWTCGLRPLCACSPAARADSTQQCPPKHSCLRSLWHDGPQGVGQALLAAVLLQRVVAPVCRRDSPPSCDPVACPTSLLPAAATLTPLWLLQGSSKLCALVPRPELHPEAHNPTNLVGWPQRVPRCARTLQRAPGRPLLQPRDLAARHRRAGPLVALGWSLQRQSQSSSHAPCPSPAAGPARSRAAGPRHSAPAAQPPPSAPLPRGPAARWCLSSRMACRSAAAPWSRTRWCLASRRRAGGRRQWTRRGSRRREA